MTLFRTKWLEIHFIIYIWEQNAQHEKLNIINKDWNHAIHLGYSSGGAEYPSVYTYVFLIKKSFDININKCINHDRRLKVYIPFSYVHIKKKSFSMYHNPVTTGI